MLSKPSPKQLQAFAPYVTSSLRWSLLLLFKEFEEQPWLWDFTLYNKHRFHCPCWCWQDVEPEGKSFLFSCSFLPVFYLLWWLNCIFSTCSWIYDGSLLYHSGFSVPLTYHSSLISFSFVGENAACKRRLFTPTGWRAFHWTFRRKCLFLHDTIPDMNPSSESYQSCRMTQRSTFS